MIKLKDLLIEGLDLKKLEAAIKDFQKKIAKQGRVTNARDEQHLEQLIKVYKQMGGRKIKEGKLTEDYKKREWEVYVADDPYGKNQKVVKRAKSKRAAVILYNKLIKTDKYFEVGMRVVKEGKLTEVSAGVNVFYFYKKANKDKNKFFKMLSDFRKKHSDTKWMKMLNYALVDFNENPKKYKTIDDKQNKLFKNLQQNKKVYEGKLSEKKFIPTVTIEKYNNVVMVKKFKTEKDADKFIKQFNKKNQLKRKKGFWGNPKTGVELFRNF